MDRWKYLRVVVDGGALIRGEADAEIERIGAEGWELASAVPRDHHGYQKEVCLIFKQPVTAAPSC